MLALAGAMFTSAAGAQAASDPYLFAYFKEPGSQGIYLALSTDGLHYTALNDGQPWLVPSHPGEIMRDVFLTRDPATHGFQAVWTWNWRGQTLGHASSPDLLTWSAQDEIPVMQDFPANNTWAPETYWDAVKKKWLILWSSSMKDSKDGHRIWSTLTEDFHTFTKPTIFFDPGYVVIDATIFHAADGPYRLIYKEQTYDPLTFQERVVTGPTLEGPWDLKMVSGFINEPWSEGPSAIQVGDRTVVFYDHYRAPRARFEAVATRDWKHWEDITPEISLPAYCKHGSFLRITAAEAERLRERHDPQTVPVP